MDILDKYIVKGFLGYFIPVALGIVALFIGIDLLSNMWRSSLPLGKLSLLYVYKIPEFFQMLLSFSLMLATMLLLSSMSLQNEILILYISGIGFLRLLVTVFILVLTIIILAFIVLDPLIPVMTKKQFQLEQGRPWQDLFTYRTGVWYRSKERIYNFSRYIPTTNTLENVSIYILDDADKIVNIIYGKKATFQDNDWVISDGKIISYNDTFPEAKKFNEISRAILEKPGDFKDFEVNEKIMTLKVLKNYISKNKSYGLNVINEEIALHLRIASIFSQIILVCLGILFFVNPLRTFSPAKSLGLCFLIAFIYHIIQRFSVSSAKAGYANAFLATWIPNLVFLIVIVYLLSRRVKYA